MSDPHDFANENPEPGDAHVQQEALKVAFQDQPSAKPTKSRWADPDLSLLKTGFGDALPFPSGVLGPFWQAWVEQSARAANAPVDYTAGTLLATVDALLGNVRWPNVEGVWEHPGVLWIGLVGNPSTAKSPGMRPVRRLINQIEAKRAATIDGEGPVHRLAAAIADLKEKAWRRAVEEAYAQDKAPPEWPQDAQIPAAPVMPVLHVVDATTEGLITTAAGSPRGPLQFSDELAGWFGGFDRYRAKGVSADRPFWLKAYDGDPYTVISTENAPLDTDAFKPSGRRLGSRTLAPSAIDRCQARSSYERRLPFALHRAGRSGEADAPAGFAVGLTGGAKQTAANP